MYNISLGAEGRYVGRSNNGLCWKNVLEAIPTTIQGMKQNAKLWKVDEMPIGVLFGVKDTWVILCDDGNKIKWSSNIQQTYPGFYKNVSEKFAKGKSYEYLGINPYRADDWFAVWSGDSVGWAVPNEFSELIKTEAAKWVTLTNAENVRKDAENAAKTAREVALLNQATRLADSQTRFNMEQADFINGWRRDPYTGERWWAG